MATKPKRKLIRQYGLGAGKKPGDKVFRRRSVDEYHSWRWTQASRRFRQEHPLCEECLKKGLFVPAEVVDHIIPVPLCADFWDESNWQSLCQKCNITKGNRDKEYIQGRKKL